MASLDSDHKRFVVKRLARFDSPSEVRDALQEEYGIEVGLSQIVYYDPTNERGRGLAQKWQELFESVRKAYLHDTASIPAAHKAVRVRDLAEAATKAREMHDFPLMAELYEQIAKEMGGAFTNKKLLEHGGEVRHVHEIDWESLTDEQVAALAAGAPPEEVIIP